MVCRGFCYTDLPIEFEGTAVWPEGGFCEVPFSVDVTARYADGVRLLMKNGSKGVRFDGDEGWVHLTDGGEIEESMNLFDAEGERIPCLE